MRSALDIYLEEHGSINNDALAWVERQTNIRTKYPRMLSGRVQGEFLYMIVRMLRPRRILEIGTFTGYSAICMALALEEGGHIDTIEKNDELEDLILEGFNRAGTEDRTSLHIGDAIDFIRERKREGGLYDLVFIDADKREYPEYFNTVIDITRHGGFILADDVLWDGKVYSDNIPSDRQTAGIVAFNEMVTADVRVESMILPLRHGLSIIRKK